MIIRKIITGMVAYVRRRRGAELQLTKETLYGNQNWRKKLVGFPNKEITPKALQSLGNISGFLKSNGVN